MSTLRLKLVKQKGWRQKDDLKQNEYADDDFVSQFLVKWRFSEILEYSKLLILILNRRNLLPSSLLETLSSSTQTLAFYKYHSEYYDTLFATYTHLFREDRVLNFCTYYTEIYKEALDHASHQASLKQLTGYHCSMLKACFLVSLTYDARIRRFVFSRHDIHYHHMHTSPPSIAKTSHFIEAIQSLVDQFISAQIGAHELSTYAINLWLSDYMFGED